MKKIITNKEGQVIKVVSDNGKDTKTDQSFKEHTDINNIMYKYRAIGIHYKNLPQPTNGKYGDFTNIKDYRSALQSVIDAQNSFMQLPSNIRKRFNNDPAALLEFVNNKENRDEAITLGLIEKPKPQPPPIPPTPPPEEPKK